MTWSFGDRWCASLGVSVTGSWPLRLLPLVVRDVLTEHNPHTIDIAYTKLPNPIWLIGGLHGNLGAPTEYFPEVPVDVLDPLEQVDATWTASAPNKVNRRVIAPHDRVCVVAEVPCETQHITIERCGRLDVGDMENWCALNKLCRIGRRWRRHRLILFRWHPAGTDTKAG